MKKVKKLHELEQKLKKKMFVWEIINVTKNYKSTK